jgi:hypothetical protein
LAGPVVFGGLLFLGGLLFFLIRTSGNRPGAEDPGEGAPRAQADDSLKKRPPPSPQPPVRRETGQGKARETPPRELTKADPRKPPPKKAAAPPPAPPLPRVKAPVLLSAAELEKQLLRVPELDFYPLVDKLRKDIHKEVESKLRRFDPQAPNGPDLKRVVEQAGRVRFDRNVNALVLEAARRQGLPVQTGPGCKVNLPTARAMQALSTALRTQQFVALPGLAMGSATCAKFRQWLKTAPIENGAGTRRILLQMLQAEAEAERLILVEQLAQANDLASGVALARRALFDSSKEVRQAAVRALKSRSPDAYRDVFLAGLRYPWAPVARHAAEALVRLNDKKAVSRLVELLGQPDPSLPVLDPRTKKHVVRELVRVNHLRNCYLCHAAAPVLGSPVGGRVPPVGKPLSRLYYEEMGGDFVRADTTFVRQDFSVFQAVEEAAPWPARQRYDFLVRRHEATAAEIARSRRASPAGYPQRTAVLYALHELTGKDYSAAAGKQKPEAWPTPPDPKSRPGPSGRQKLLADLAALGVGPRAKPHRKAASPDGKFVAAVAGNEAVITAVGSPQVRVRLLGHPCQVTSVWWSLDNKVITTDDVQGQVIVYEASTGKQRMAFFR